MPAQGVLLVRAAQPEASLLRVPVSLVRAGQVWPPGVLLVRARRVPLLPVLAR